MTTPPNPRDGLSDDTDTLLGRINIAAAELARRAADREARPAPASAEALVRKLIQAACRQENAPCVANQDALAEARAAVVSALAASDPLPGMSPMNRTVAYCAATKLRDLGYEWDGHDWIAASTPPAEAQPCGCPPNVCSTEFWKDGRRPASCRIAPTDKETNDGKMAGGVVAGGADRGAADSVAAGSGRDSLAGVPLTGAWKPGEWFQASSVDDMQAFFRARLPVIREAAREHGYAIGVHGSERRDFDLMAMPWRDGASDAETLARAVAVAACGLTRSGPYDWEKKPLGRIATSIPVCWTPPRDVLSDGHIDLSVMPGAAATGAAGEPQPREGWKPIETAPRDGTHIAAWSLSDPGVLRIVRWGRHLGSKSSPEGWVTITRGVAVSNLPTHWLPMPATSPPQADSGAAGGQGDKP